jgi:hypothetical protein
LLRERLLLKVGPELLAMDGGLMAVMVYKYQRGRNLQQA